MLIPGLGLPARILAASDAPASFVALMPGHAGTRRFALPAGALLTAGVVVALTLGLRGADKLPPIPRAGDLTPSAAAPLGYDPRHMTQFVTRATAGEAHVLFTKSPGGAVATAERVARFSGLIRQVTAGTSVDPA